MRLTADRRQTYAAYIASPEWAAKRKQAFETHGAYCRGCGVHTVTLHVHHRTYDRLGAETMADLVILCETCHDGVHRLVDAGTPLGEATDAVVDSTPAVDTRVTADFVPLNRRPGYSQPALTGPEGRLGGLPIVLPSDTSRLASGERSPLPGDAGPREGRFSSCPAAEKCHDGQAQPTRPPASRQPRAEQTGGREPRGDHHKQHVAPTRSGQRWAAHCTCGYTSATRATLEQALTAAIHHHRKHAKSAAR